MPAGKSSKGSVDLVQKVCEQSSQASVVVSADKCWTETQSSNERCTVVCSHEVPGVHETTPQSHNGMNTTTTQVQRVVSAYDHAPTSSKLIEDAAQALWSRGLVVQKLEIMLGRRPANKELHCVTHRHCQTGQKVICFRFTSAAIMHGYFSFIENEYQYGRPTMTLPDLRTAQPAAAGTESLDQCGLEKSRIQARQAVLLHIED
jgi:hypothetical protein